MRNGNYTESANEMSITQIITEQAASVVDAATSPNGTIPVIGTVGIANWLGSLPEIINVMTAIYLFLLVTHKAYSMWIEYKKAKASKGKE